MSAGLKGVAGTGLVERLWFRCDRAQGAAMRGTSDVRWRSGSVQGGQGAEGQGLEGHTFVEIARIQTEYQQTRSTN